MAPQVKLQTRLYQVSDGFHQIAFKIINNDSISVDLKRFRLVYYRWAVFNPAERLYNNYKGYTIDNGNPQPGGSWFGVRSVESDSICVIEYEYNTELYPPCMKTASPDGIHGVNKMFNLQQTARLDGYNASTKDSTLVAGGAISEATIYLRNSEWKKFPTISGVNSVAWGYSYTDITTYTDVPTVVLEYNGVDDPTSESFMVSDNWEVVNGSHPYPNCIGHRRMPTTEDNTCIFASIDAMISSENPNNNYGGDTKANLHNDILLGNRKFLINFNRDKLIGKSFYRAMLHAFTTNDEATQWVTGVDIYGITNTWTESGATWNSTSSKDTLLGKFELSSNGNDNKNLGTDIFFTSPDSAKPENEPNGYVLELEVDPTKPLNNYALVNYFTREYAPNSRTSPALYVNYGTPVAMRDIFISNNSITENTIQNTSVGTLTTTMLSETDTFVYELVDGIGGRDNIYFTLIGDTLYTAASFNYEQISELYIRIKSTASDLTEAEKQFTIHVLDINEVPLNISISNNTIPENTAIGEIIGVFTSSDTDGDTEFTYTLIDGIGSNDNNSFIIVGDTLTLNTTLNYNTKNTYTIRVNSMDIGGLSVSKQFFINITDVLAAPTDIFLSNNAVIENAEVDITIGQLSTLDNDSIYFTYRLVSGVGDTNNSDFTIIGNNLVANKSFNYELGHSKSIRIRSTDNTGLWIEKQFIIDILDINESPTNIELSNNNVYDGKPVDTYIGTLSTMDDDNNGPYTYSLVTGVGSSNNTQFKLVNDSLLTATSFDYFDGNYRYIRIRSTDNAGMYFEKTFIINVLNANQQPSDILITNSTFYENTPANSIIAALSSTDADKNDSFTYTLVAGAGDVDNDKFIIIDNKLLTHTTFVVNEPTDYTIRIRSTDNGGLWVEKSFTITALPVWENIMWTDKYAYAPGSLVRIYFKDTNLDFTKAVVKLHNVQIMNITYVNSTELRINAMISNKTTLTGARRITVSDGNISMSANIYITTDGNDSNTNTQVTSIRVKRSKIVESGPGAPGVQFSAIVDE